MLRPWIALVVLLSALFMTALEGIALATFFTFLGLEFFGLLVGFLALISGLAGVLTGKDNFSSRTRRVVFHIDLILSVLLALATLFMICGTFLAASVYIYIAILVGTPGVREVMILFGVPMIPFIGLIIVKCALVLVYLTAFALCITAVVLNRRHLSTGQEP